MLEYASVTRVVAATVGFTVGINTNNREFYIHLLPPSGTLIKPRIREMEDPRGKHLDHLLIVSRSGTLA